MKTIKERDTSGLMGWQAYPSIQRWSGELLSLIGLTPLEVANRLETLFQFCAQREIDPEIMAYECKQGEERLARRAYYLHLASQTPANLIVQSFLVHNGVNVFGDLICMPSTRELLAAEQGSQWIRDVRPSTQDEGKREL